LRRWPCGCDLARSLGHADQLIFMTPTPPISKPIPLRTNVASATSLECYVIDPRSACKVWIEKLFSRRKRKHCGGGRKHSSPVHRCPAGGVGRLEADCCFHQLPDNFLSECMYRNQHAAVFVVLPTIPWAFPTPITRNADPSTASTWPLGEPFGKEKKDRARRFPRASPLFRGCQIVRHR